MTIKQASEVTGISVDNLRYYERIGLIPKYPAASLASASMMIQF